jgi:hypothetical protein
VTNHPNTSSKKYIKLTRCPVCIRLLCKRVPIHDCKEEAYILQIRHRGLTVYTYEAIIRCIACGAAVRVSAEKGIIGKEVAQALVLLEK